LERLGIGSSIIGLRRGGREDKLSRNSKEAKTGQTEGRDHDVGIREGRAVKGGLALSTVLKNRKKMNDKRDAPETRPGPEKDEIMLP